MSAVLAYADAVLRRRDWAHGPAQDRQAIVVLVGLVCLFGTSYGAVMGAFGGVTGDRWLQVAYSAIKVPLLLLATFAISLPSYFVLNTLLGLRADFAEAVRALAATQAGVAITLASLAPFTALWYLSSGEYQAAVMFNAVMFAVASFAGQVLLRAYCRPLMLRNRRHRWLLWSWLAVYAFVGIQMGWLLRPFVGNPTMPAQFVREDVWGNAYEVMLRLGWELVR